MNKHKHVMAGSGKWLTVPKVLVILIGCVLLGFFISSPSKIAAEPLRTYNQEPVASIKTIPKRLWAEDSEKDLNEDGESLADFNPSLDSKPNSDIEPPQNEDVTIPRVVHDKWIVVTSINPPTKDIDELTRIPGWKLLVVGDRKTPTKWTHPEAVFLSIDAQQKLGYETVKLMPEKKYARKTIGYLYAIQHGAKFIYDTDDDNAPWPKPDLSSFIFDDEFTGLVVDTQGPYNPYAHFGQLTIWPRGFPLDAIAAPQPRRYSLKRMKTPGIQQAVVNGDPDVDAIFRLTRKGSNSLEARLNVSFDVTAPPVVLPVGSMSPYNAQSTLFHYKAFWSLLLPPSRHLRVTDIWRSYFSQRLMWLLNDRLMFMPPKAFQFRNAHNYIEDAFNEFQLYEQSSDLVDFLLKWTCDSLDFFQCVLDLATEMADRKNWDTSDVKIISAWINDLKAIGYTQPRLKDGIRKDKSVYDNTEIIYYPIEKPTSIPYSTENRFLHSYSRVDQIETFVQKTCSALTGNAKIWASNQSPLFGDVLLVIVDDNLRTDVMQYYEIAYRVNFPNMIYCGRGAAGITVLANQNVSYLQMNENRQDDDSTSRLLDCISVVRQMNYDVSGYLVLRNSVVINYWNLIALNKDLFWSVGTKDLNVNNVNARSKRQSNTDTNVFYIPKRRDKYFSKEALETTSADTENPINAAILKVIRFKNTGEKQEIIPVDDDINLKTSGENFNSFNLTPLLQAAPLEAQSRGQYEFCNVILPVLMKKSGMSQTSSNLQ